MVKGLSTFQDYFKDFSDHYVIIGGTACDMILEAAALTPRATKDIDMILVVEALDAEFVKQFWKFIKDGRYQRTEKNEGERKYYRFMKPENAAFPTQVELFSKVPELLDVDPEVHLTPIPAGDDQSDLSAILMNEEYYAYTIANSTKEQNLQRANLEALVCLKAKAYLEISERKAKGENAEEKDIKKHKGDIFRLSAMLSGTDVFEVPVTIKKDLQAFTDAVKNDLPGKELFKSMGLGNLDPAKVHEQLIANFQLD